MSISMTAEAEAKIRERVESGQYASADEVVGEALRLLEEHEKLQKLRALIDEGLKGPFTPLTRESWDESLERARRRYRAGEKPSPDVMPFDAAE